MPESREVYGQDMAKKIYQYSHTNPLDELGLRPKSWYNYHRMNK